MSLEVIKSIINDDKNSLYYNKSDLVSNNKYLVYCAIDSCLDKYSHKMVDYLLSNSRSGGFQHKIFQKYIELLEQSLPLHFFINNKEIKIETLLDEHLSLFDGISIFNGIVLENLEVKNGTKEFYIGGRKASYAKPFYIGKLLRILDKNSKTNLLEKVVEYSFNKIKMKDLSPGSEIEVAHLRIPPHYQMGGMTYVNRIRKNIIDKARIILHN